MDTFLLLFLSSSTGVYILYYNIYIYIVLYITITIMYYIIVIMLCRPDGRGVVLLTSWKVRPLATSGRWFWFPHQLNQFPQQMITTICAVVVLRSSIMWAFKSCLVCSINRGQSNQLHKLKANINYFTNLKFLYVATKGPHEVRVLANLLLWWERSRIAHWKQAKIFAHAWEPHWSSKRCNVYCIIDTIKASKTDQSWGLGVGQACWLILNLPIWRKMLPAPYGSILFGREDSQGCRLVKVIKLACVSNYSNYTSWHGSHQASCGL